MSLFSKPPDVDQLLAKKNIRGLLKALGYQKTQQVRAAAARALGELQNQSSVEPLIAALKDSEIDVQIAAIQALGMLKDQRATQALIALLRSQNAIIQEQAVRALGELGDQRAVEPLIDILEFKRDQIYQHFVVQHTAIQALGKLRNPQACEPLIDLLQIRENRNEIKWVQRAAAEVLGQAGDVRAIEPLIELLRDSNAATYALGQRSLGEIEADQALQRAIILALGSLSSGTTIEKILKLTEEKDTAETAVVVLHRVLEQHTTEIATDSLRAILHLDKVVARRPAGSRGQPDKQEEIAMDCSPVKRLAQQELIRRGLRN